MVRREKDVVFSTRLAFGGIIVVPGILCVRGIKYSPMTGFRRSHLRLLGMAVLAGAGFRLGIPGLAEVIEGIWSHAEPASRAFLPLELQGMIGIFGILVLGIVIYLNYEIFMKGAKRGRRGLLITVCGFCAGILLANIVIAALFQ